jgi:hypothetical protein
MIKYCSFLFVLLQSYFLLEAQVESPFFKYHLYGKQLSFNVNAQYGSTALNNKINNKFLFGGTIDENLKLENQKRLKKTNILGGFTNVDFSTIFGHDTAKFHYLISVSTQDFYSVKFTDDAYNLLLFGNNTLKGQSVDLSMTNYRHFSFQNFTFGFIFNRLKSTSAKIGLSASLFTTDEFTEFKFAKNSSLYTSEDATEVIFSNKSEYITTNPKKKNIYSINGIGTGVNFYVDAPYTTKNKKAARILFALNNVGFVFLNNKTETYFGDSNYVFKGEEVKDINQFFSSGFNKYNRDSLLKNNFVLSKKSKIAVIPASFTLGNYWYFTKKYYAGLFVNYVFNSDYRAYFYTEQYWQPNKTLTFNGHLGYGGFNKLNIGAGITINMKNKFVIATGSNQLLGLLFPNQFGSEGAYLSLVKKIK